MAESEGESAFVFAVSVFWVHAFSLSKIEECPENLPRLKFKLISKSFYELTQNKVVFVSYATLLRQKNSEHCSVYLSFSS